METVKNKKVEKWNDKPRIDAKQELQKEQTERMHRGKLSKIHDKLD